MPKTTLLTPLFCPKRTANRLLVREVLDEAKRAAGLHPNAGMKNGTGPLLWLVDARSEYRDHCELAVEAGECTWRHVLLEEVFEAVAEKRKDRLRAELIQVMAVCLRWIHRLDGVQS